MKTCLHTTLLPLLLAASTAAQSHSVALSWSPSASMGVAGYNLYRGTQTGGPYAPLTFVTSTAYTDTTVVSGLTYYYVTTAVGVSGGESAYSNAAAVTMPGTPPPPPPTPTLLIGDQNVESSLDDDSSGEAEAFQATAAGTGTVATLVLYLDGSSTASQVVVGIYVDSGSGHPGTLLGQGTSTAPAAGTWNSFALTPNVNITSGSHYWLALLGTGGGTIKYRDKSSGGGCVSETSASRSLTTLPSTWSTGNVWPSCPLSAYGISPSTPIGTLTFSPSPLTFCNISVGGSASAPVRLSNTGTSNVTITSATSNGVTFSGLLLPLTLTPTQSVVFGVTLAPTTTGNISGSVTLTSNASNPQATLPVSATAVAGP